MTLRQKVKIAMIGKNLTEIEISRRMGISRQHFRKITNGDRRLTDFRKNQLMEILEVTTDFLIGGES